YLIAAFSILSLVLGAAVASILSVKLSSSLVRPVLKLTSTIRKFTTGNKNITANVNSDDEIGRLGASFNEMTRQLNESFESLEAQIIERKQAQKKALRRMEQLVQADKMVSLGILVSGVAHEINNPNQFIMSHIEPLKNAWEGAIPVLDRYFEQYGDFRVGGTNYSLIKKKIPQIFSNISRGSERIKIIVDELRDFVNEKPQDDNARVNINDVVDSALTLISNMIKNTTNDFSFRKDENIPLILGHYQRLEQVIVNLLQNSCQAINSKADAICIHTQYDETDQEVLLVIHDGGKGIPQENLVHITDPFFTTKREQGGTGLGLSISSRIIADHKGSMVFESKNGKGTTVMIRLPVNTKEEK
ncbi:MAG: HAMP domain-containing protein, partial [Desulfobacula sp.]|nr:HAMP domain-containing protein [Desulfobacula sp.]